METPKGGVPAMLIEAVDFPTGHSMALN